jgi:hypothetical protein
MTHGHDGIPSDCAKSQVTLESTKSVQAGELRLPTRSLNEDTTDNRSGHITSGSGFPASFCRTHRPFHVSSQVRVDMVVQSEVAQGLD